MAGHQPEFVLCCCMHKKIWIKLFATILVVFNIAACSRRVTPVEEGNQLQILHLGNLSEPVDLDPQVVTGVSEYNIISALLEGLVSENPRTLNPEPGTARSWQISDDRLSYTFEIYPDARWSNGDPVTAADFVFSYRRMLSPSFGAKYAYMLYPLKNAAAYHRGEITDFEQVGVKALDTHTLLLELQTQTPYLLQLLTHHSWFPVHPPTIRAAGSIEGPGKRWTTPENYVGNGPFILKEWEHGKRIIVSKSPTYRDSETVKLNEIHFHAIGDHSIEERSFRAGQLHVTGTIPLDRIAWYRDNRPEVLRLDPYLGTYYYLLNVRRPPLDDVRVRRALSMAVNRQDLVDYVTKAGEEPAFHFTPLIPGGYHTSARIEADLDQARKLLAEAGYPDGKDFPEIELLINTSDAHSRIAQAVQQMWKENLGINIQVVNMEWKVYMAATQHGEYHLARAGWIGDYLDPNTFLDLWVTSGGNNRTGWSNAAYDAAIHAAAMTDDNKERYSHFDRAEQILLEEMPVIPLYFYRSKSLLQPSVRGWHPTLLDHHPYKYIYLEP